jgi:hypothetical protein
VHQHFFFSMQQLESRFRRFRAVVQKPLGLTTWRRIDQVCVWVGAVTHIAKNYLADQIDGKIPLILGTPFPCLLFFVESNMILCL